jgi:thiol-disulfide isomerase/thioredoxin
LYYVYTKFDNDLLRLNNGAFYGDVLKITDLMIKTATPHLSIKKIRPKNWLLILLIVAVSLGISLLSGALNWLNQFVICGITYLLVGLLYRKDFRISRLIYGAIVVLPFLSIYAVYAVVHGFSHIYPIAFLPMISIFTGLLFNKLFADGMSKSLILTYISASIAIILLMGYFGMPNWLAYSFGKNNADRFDAPPIQLISENGETFDLNNQSGKILVLDFWSTSCGICYKKFPDFNRLKQKYASKTEIEFYAVNLIQPREQLSAVKNVPGSFSYSFKTLYTDNHSANQIRELLKINAVPAIVIINKNGEVVYSGDFNIEKYVFVGNTYDLIETALKHE